MDYKLCLVTGASSGLGRAVATRLAGMGAHVVMVSRDNARGEAAKKDIVSQSKNQSVDLMLADLSSLSSVRGLASEFKAKYPRLDVLINNAAVYRGTRAVTAEGLETMFATNYLGPFLLTRLLIPQLEEARPSRIINVTAPSTTRPNLDDLQGEGKFGSLKAFGASKAADLLFTYELARMLKGRGVTVNAYHPGLVKTGLMREAPPMVRLVSGVMNLLAGSTPDGASEGLAQLATSAQFADTSGQLVHGMKVIKAPLIEDVELQERLWKVSCRLTGVQEGI